MILAEDFWLRGKAAQSSMMQLWAYNTAFAGTATIQAWKMGLSAPTGFWQAMARAGAEACLPMRRDVAQAQEAPAKKTAPATPRAAARSRNPRPRRRFPKKAGQTGARARSRADPEVPAPSPHLLDAPRGGKADDLTVLKGVGAKLATSLNEFGIYHFDQLATLDDTGIDWLNDQQAGFKMICARYGVVEQARARLA
jgi:predicted flap endonuclease-1-like 5' DNA nuclease